MLSGAWFAFAWSGMHSSVFTFWWCCRCCCRCCRWCCCRLPFAWDLSARLNTCTCMSVGNAPRRYTCECCRQLLRKVVAWLCFGVCSHVLICDKNGWEGIWEWVGYLTQSFGGIGWTRWYRIYHWEHSKLWAQFLHCRFRRSHSNVTRESNTDFALAISFNVSWMLFASVFRECVGKYHRRRQDPGRQWQNEDKGGSEEVCAIPQQMTDRQSVLVRITPSISIRVAF